MNDSTFQAVLRLRAQKMREVLASKGVEYAREDRLSNFKKAGAAMACSPEKACVGFWMKHVISLTDLVNDLDRGKVASMAMWQEKIGDAVNYLVLLEALIFDRENSK